MTGIELKEAKEELEFVIDRFYDFPKETNVTNSINNVQNAIKAINELEDYYAVGTVEECREARERQIRKKRILDSYCGFNSYECPICGTDVSHENNFCHKCGQRLE